MLSRIENILQSIIDSSEYDGPVQSRIEQLLLDVKSVISTGGSGGVTEATVTTMITSSINALIDGAPDEYNTLGKIAAKLLLTDEQIQTITEQVNNRYTKEETNELVSKIPKFAIEVVAKLPTKNISTTTVYLKTGSKSDPDNIYDEYIYVKSKWELLGSQTIDLSGYVTTDALTTALSDKVDKVPDKGLSTNDFTTALKTKLEGIAEGATKTIVDTELSSTSINPLQNKAVTKNIHDISNSIVTNMIDVSKIPSTTAYGVTRTVYPDGKIAFNGTSTLTSDYFLVLMASRTLTAGTYRFTPNGTAISGAVPTVYQLYKDGKYLKGISPSKVITIDTDGAYGIGAVINSQATINTEFYPMLESGSDAHNYVRYTGDTGSLNSDLAALVSKFNDPGWTSISPGSDVVSGSISYKQSNLIVDIIGKNIKVLNAAKTVSIGTIESTQCPHVDTKVPTNITDAFANISTSGTISLEHTTGTLSTSDSYTFSLTYLT
nr:MAG TPA: hypothetical protein [Caudoviricetes sp.]